MSEKYTPEPWVHNCVDLIGADGETVASAHGLFSRRNRHLDRIVSCVNALQGIPNPQAYRKAVEELIAAIKEAPACGCRSSDKKTWHHETCWAPRLIAALAPFRSGK